MDNVDKKNFCKPKRISFDEYEYYCNVGMKDEKCKYGAVREAICCFRKGAFCTRIVAQEDAMRKMGIVKNKEI